MAEVSSCKCEERFLSKILVYLPLYANLHFDVPRVVKQEADQTAFNSDSLSSIHALGYLYLVANVTVSLSINL